MSKKSIFEQYAYFPKEDGTWNDLYDVFNEHPQQHPVILKRACVEMSEFVHFCMEICVFYWSETNKKYQQFPINDKDVLNKENFQIKLFHENVTIDTSTDLSTVPRKNIKGLVAMVRYRTHNYRYSDMFRELLNGNTFLEEAALPNL